MLSTGFLSRLLQVALQFSISFHALPLRGAVSWRHYFGRYALPLTNHFIRLDNMIEPSVRVVSKDKRKIRLKVREIHVSRWFCEISLLIFVAKLLLARNLPITFTSNDFSRFSESSPLNTALVTVNFKRLVDGRLSLTGDSADTFKALVVRCPLNINFVVVAECDFD